MLFNKLFNKCNHNWEIAGEYYIYDLYAPVTNCYTIKVICYKCSKCSKTKKIKKW